MPRLSRMTPPNTGPPITRRAARDRPGPPVCGLRASARCESLPLHAQRWLGCFRTAVRLDVLVVQRLPATIGRHRVQDAVDELHEIVLALLDPDPERLLAERFAADLQALVLLREAEENRVIGRDGLTASVKERGRS